MERHWGNMDSSHIFFQFHDVRECEQRDLQSSENQNITFLILRSHNGVES